MHKKYTAFNLLRFVKSTHPKQRRLSLLQNTYDLSTNNAIPKKTLFKPI